jgi:hypothetical protein
MTLDADEFIRRFLLHVLPRGFMRLRHYGFLANRHKARTLRRCRELLGQPAEPPPRRAKSVVQWMQEVTGIDLTHNVRAVALAHSYGSLWPPCLHLGSAEELLWRCQSMTRHEPAGLPKAAVADTITGSSEPPGGRASLWGSEAPNLWSPGPASPSRGGASGALIPFSRLCASCYH